MDIESTLFIRAAGFALRHRAADLDVLVLRDQESRRRSTGAPRCTIPTAWRCGRARASGCGARSTIPRASWSRPSSTTIRAASASASATASSTTISTASIYDRRPTLWVEPLPSPQGQRLGQGIDPALRDPDRRRDPRQHRGDVGAREAGSGRRRAQPELSPALARRRTLSRASSARCVATRLGRGGQPGLPRPKGVRKFVVEFLGGPLATLPYGVKPDMVVTASRGSLQGYRLSKPCPTTCPAIGAPSST